MNYLKPADDLCFKSEFNLLTIEREWSKSPDQLESKIKKLA